MIVERLLAGLACMALGAGVQAAYIIVDDIGGPVQMHPGSMPGMLDPGSGILTEGAMSSAHTTLNDAGIGTDGHVTFLLANTDAGLTFTALIDSNADLGLAGMAESALALSSTAPISLDWYVNAEAGDQTYWSDLGNGFQMYEALFSWDGASEGDGLAWGSLAPGDFVSFHFTDVNAQALHPDVPFRFLSYSANDWHVVATGDFTAGDQFVFSFQVVPAPGALCLLTLAGLGAAPRRRR